MAHHDLRPDGKTDLLKKALESPEKTQRLLVGECPFELEMTEEIKYLILDFKYNCGARWNFWMESPREADGWTKFAFNVKIGKKNRSFAYKTRVVFSDRLQHLRHNVVVQENPEECAVVISWTVPS